jgi:alkanesulfonate monooxygenase SsuD/methylene tetrahydromethanopterin reductase-like flavin-dependent oxidoreductase (luciferase family)
MLRIGVRVPRRFEDAGEYLADVRALDAAGVDSLWLDAAGHDPWLLLAGIAAVTGSARLVVPLRLAEGLAPATLEDRLTTLGRLSRGRVSLALAGEAFVGAALEDIVTLARRHDCPVMVPAAGAGEACAAARWADGVIGLGGSPEHLGAALPPIRQAREGAGLTQPFELWAQIAMPDDRAQWRTLRAAYETAGATGLIVPADPRLLDLLRNGDEEDDRADLDLAQG